MRFWSRWMNAKLTDVNCPFRIRHATDRCLRTTKTVLFTHDNDNESCFVYFSYDWKHGKRLRLTTMADSNKRKKAAYFAKCGAKKSRTQFTLHPGLKGFLATCNFREKDCVKEAINILSEFADKIYGEDKVRFSMFLPRCPKSILC